MIGIIGDQLLLVWVNDCCDSQMTVPLALAARALTTEQFPLYSLRTCCPEAEVVIISIAHTFVVTTDVWGIVFTKALLFAAMDLAAAEDGTHAEVTIWAFFGCTPPNQRIVAITPIPKIKRSIVPKTQGQISFLLKKSASAPGPMRIFGSVVVNSKLLICAENPHQNPAPMNSGT